ncbi:MAG: ABC transporter permease [Sorangiineae bacterium]|nr:ABC transporter permease [Polyangiaceae bacterium]MEB2321819.1 ABC transporter permease [Sorangiineae bacterium]
MSPMLTIAKREFRSYFDSPLAYVVICVSFLALGGFFFMFRGGFWQLDRATLQNMFEYMPWGLSILVIPVVTMRLIAEEKRSGTLEMLITLPVKDSDVVLGKYLGALGLVLTLVLASLIYPLAMFKWPWNLGPLDMGPVLSGYLGLILFSAAATALGLLISALTDSQAIAFFITFFVLLVLWLIGTFAESMGGVLGNVLSFISFQSRLDGFTRGLMDTRDIVYFLSVTGLALVVAFRALERRKWA